MTEENKTDSSDDKLVSLISQEGEAFQVSLDAALISELVKTMVDGKFCLFVYINLKISCLETQSSEEVPEVPIVNVKSQTLSKVIEFLIEYKKNKMPSIPRVIV